MHNFLYILLSIQFVQGFKLFHYHIPYEFDGTIGYHEKQLKEAMYSDSQQQQIIHKEINTQIQNNNTKISLNQKYDNHKNNTTPFFRKEFQYVTKQQKNSDFTSNNANLVDIKYNKRIYMTKPIDQFTRTLFKIQEIKDKFYPQSNQTLFDQVYINYPYIPILFDKDISKTATLLKKDQLQLAKNISDMQKQKQISSNDGIIDNYNQDQFIQPNPQLNDQKKINTKSIF